MFRLLIAIQILRFCQANYINDVYWRRSIIGYQHIPIILNICYLFQTEVNNKGVVDALFLNSPTYHRAIMSEETDNIESSADKSNITVANKPNLMIYPADFQVPSNERASAAIPISITITSSGDTIIKSFKNKPHSNEIFKRRVAKMAIAPVNAPEVGGFPEGENPSLSTAGYGSKTEEQTPSPSESGQYGKRRK